MPISFDTQPSDLGFYFTNLAILVEKHQPPSIEHAAYTTLSQEAKRLADQ